MFIVIDGNDGSGKSTLIKNLKIKLSKEIKENIITTREPDNSQSEFNKKVTSFLLTNNQNDACNDLLLFMANRNEHIKKLIVPALEEQQIIISDRYFYSSAVYQGYSNQIKTSKYDKTCTNLTYKKVWKINYLLFNHCLPNLTFFILTNPKIAIERIKTNRSNNNYFDKQNFQYHKIIYRGYLKLYKYLKRKHPLLKIFIINGLKEPEIITNKINNIILKFINNK